jgi:hypothetical protein
MNGKGRCSWMRAKLEGVGRDVEKIELFDGHVVGQCRLQDAQGAGETHGGTRWLREKNGSVNFKVA